MSTFIEELSYVQDWHLQLCTAGRYSAYTTPPHFCSDWLNEWWAGGSSGGGGGADSKGGGGADSSSGGGADSDYRFVYVGPRGSWTPLHSDVFSSYRRVLHVVYSI